jgi:hypothetical protein
MPVRDVLARKLGLACSTARDALDLAARVASPRVLAHLQEFRRSLRPYNTVRPAAELAAHIGDMSS